MKEKDALVSIIVPARNVAGYLPASIQSVLNQSHSNWELIIIENDCSDNTAEVIKRYTDPRIIHLQTYETGLSNARNIGLERATGHYVCFLDADDRLPEHSLRDRIALFEQDSDVCFVDGKVVVYDHYMRNVLLDWTPAFRGTPDRQMRRIRPGCFAGITWMIKRDVIGSSRFDNSWTHLEDRVFFLNIADKGKYNFTPTEVYHIRRRPGSLMTQHSALEKAFIRFMKVAQTPEYFDSDTIRAEKRIFHRIFFRTYAKQFRLVSAIRHYILMFLTYFS